MAYGENVLKKVLSRLAGGVFSLALLAACAAQQPKVDTQLLSLENRLTGLLTRNDQLQEQLRLEKNIAAKLQMELVERQAEIKRLKQQQHPPPAMEETPKSLRIPLPSTRAEAVAYLAEVKTEVAAFQENVPAEKQPVVQQIDTLLGQSSAALAQDNFDTATVLASQAMDLVRSARQKTAPPSKKPPQNTYTAFAVPVQLRVMKDSNVRSLPGVHGKILDTVPADRVVTADGATDTWIKVRLENEREGWIYFSLLSAQ